MDSPNLTQLLIGHPFYAAAAARVDDVVRRTLDGEQQILPLCGPSRVGKTYATLPAQQQFPPQQEGARRTVPWLYIKMAQAPSLSSLPRAILKAAGMGAWASRHGGPEVLTGYAQDAVSRLGVRFLVIDEFHHYAEKGAKASALDAANAVKNFVDQTGLSCILPGLPSTMALLNRDEQLRARALAPHHFLPYVWAIENHRASFEAVLADILGHLETSGFAFSVPPDFALRVYTSSAGRIGMVVKLLNEACDLARANKLINTAIMRKAHGQAVRHETESANPFVGPVSDTDALASFIKLMHESGYTAEFLIQVAQAEGADPAFIDSLLKLTKMANTKKLQGRFGC
jgi:hypothetical protein